jgi:hypothetical protein
MLVYVHIQVHNAYVCVHCGMQCMCTCTFRYTMHVYMHTPVDNAPFHCSSINHALGSISIMFNVTNTFFLIFRGLLSVFPSYIAFPIVFRSVYYLVLFVAILNNPAHISLPYPCNFTHSAGPYPQSLFCFYLCLLSTFTALCLTYFRSSHAIHASVLSARCLTSESGRAGICFACTVHSRCSSCILQQFIISKAVSFFLSMYPFCWYIHFELTTESSKWIQ